MKRSLEERLTDAVAGSDLAKRLPICGAPFLELRSEDPAARALDGRVLTGLARVLASQPKAAGFLSHRPELLERIAHSDAETLIERARELLASSLRTDPDDLEGCLDELRILRRDETCLAACLDLGQVVDFEAVSHFLSIVAETITRLALDLARRSVDPSLPELAFSVIGMGKIAGREFTYHSDLDLIFLYEGGPDEVARVSRIGQRLVAYLSTMTGAGVAYTVDTRLRPSGQQGMLVTSYAGFEQYQCEKAQTWEHLALLRARAIAGGVDAAQAVLDRTRQAVIGAGQDDWAYLADMRARVEAERGGESEGAIPIKTGRGGLMDIDFVAGGGLLERGAVFLPAVPSVPAMLRAVAGGNRVETLLSDYRTLRVLVARCRWCRSHATEELQTEDESLGIVAELLEPGLAPFELLERVASVRERVRAAYDAVVGAGSIRALGDPPDRAGAEGDSGANL
jgi:glutamate-ammonia-ligase adenylyltransferase